MKAELDRTLEAMTAVIREHILPRLDDDFARGQAYGLISLLQQFGLQLDWSVASMAAQVARQREAAAALTALCEGTDAPAAPQVRGDLAACLSGSELRTLRDQGDEWLSSLFEWLERARPQLPADLIVRIEEAGRACARDLATMEVKLSPRSMLAQISTGREPDQPA
ncbi:MAG: hypothetical protein ABI574_14655 [Burkholderiales bacterium]